MKKNILFLAIVCLISFVGCTSKTGKTIENIKLGIKKETTASAKYAAYGQKAWVEGFDTIAQLFDATSKAEAIHASNHELVLKSFRVDMDPFTPQFRVKSTLENLQESIDGESYEVKDMYPMFIADATTKKLKRATVQSLTWALASEKKHVDMFKKALEAVKTKTEYKLPFEYEVCPVCGNTFDKAHAPEHCELCNADKALFIEIK